MAEEQSRTDPSYVRIQRKLEMQIRSGALGTGCRLPGTRELARQEGVSPMTVNQALQGLVRDGWVVRRPGSGTYVNDPASMPADEATVVVAAPFPMYPDEDVYSQTPLRAIAECTAEEACRLVVTQTPANGLPALVDANRHAAFIMVAPLDDGFESLTALHHQGVPFVVMGASWPEAPFACVDSDNVGGQRKGVEYLIRLGHERIACCLGSLDSTNCRDRREGYRQALRAHGLCSGPSLEIECGSNLDLDATARRRLTDLVIGADPVTAVACVGFYLTLAVYSLLRDLQLAVPEDVSVLGFDDPRTAEHLNPPMTTLRQPLYSMGQRAARRAISLLRCRTAPVGAVEYEPIELVARASCARPRPSRRTTPTTGASEPG